MTELTRNQLTAIVWRNTHPAKRGLLGRSKSIAVLRNLRRQHLPLEALPYPELLTLAHLASRNAWRAAFHALGYSVIHEFGQAEWAVALGPDVPPAVVSLVTGEQIAVDTSCQRHSHESLMQRARAECGRRNS